MALTYAADLTEALKAQEESMVANAKQGTNHKVKPSHATKKSCGHTKPKAPVISLEQEGRLRVCNLLALFGVSHATLYSGLKSKRYPKPDGYDGKIPYWNTLTIRQYLQG